eukprot:TRINITY_DN1078_c0_g1_i1.p1 TRINITY_DN1078_c0_g1~~TRINITY_DN1078_c0_g1_i1.p1  ORF type:complete len:329 (-),score=4.73 TRINITY_DN1078_c0_g1_i1:227-1213(-)
MPWGSAPAEADQVTALVEEISTDSSPESAASGLYRLQALFSSAKQETLMELMEIGGIEAIVASMTAHLRSASVQANGCRALSSFISAEGGTGLGFIELTKLHLSCGNAVYQSGGIKAILAAMKAHLRTEDVQKQGLTVLSGICHPLERDRLWSAEDGVIGAVVSAMRAHPGSVGVQEQGCKSLTMVYGVEYAAKVVAAGGVEAVVAAMTAHNGTFPLEYACGALSNVASAGYEAKVAAAGGIEAIVAALRTCSVPFYGCEALWKIAHADANLLVAVAKAGAADVLEAAIPLARYTEAGDDIAELVVKLRSVKTPLTVDAMNVVERSRL